MTFTGTHGASASGPGSSGLDAAVFDLDGLLVDSEPLWHVAEVNVFGSYGVPLTPQMCLETKGRYVAEAVMHWYERYPWEPFELDVIVEEILSAVGDLIESSLELKPGALEAIEACQQRGLRLAVASSSPDRLIHAAVDRFGLADVFEVIRSAEHEVAGKPNPAVFLTAASQLGVEPGRCVVFEDSPAGVVAAKRAGMLCVCVPEDEIEVTGVAGETEALDGMLVSAPPPFRPADVLLSSLERLDASAWARLQITSGAYVRATESHRPPERAPIIVNPGDLLEVGDRDDEWPAFALVTKTDGSQGWVPAMAVTLLEGDTYTVRPGHSYDTTELAVDRGEELLVVEPDLGSSWLLCKKASGAEGWVPVSSVELA